PRLTPVVRPFASTPPNSRSESDWFGVISVWGTPKLHAGNSITCLNSTPPTGKVCCAGSPHCCGRSSVAALSEFSIVLLGLGLNCGNATRLLMQRIQVQDRWPFVAAVCVLILGSVGLGGFW